MSKLLPADRFLGLTMSAFYSSFSFNETENSEVNLYWLITIPNSSQLKYTNSMLLSEQMVFVRECMRLKSPPF